MNQYQQQLQEKQLKDQFDREKKFREHQKIKNEASYAKSVLLS